jgi:chromosome segregation and condensation protein ScpB
MFFSYIFDYFELISASIGLPPIVLICAIALFIFMFALGLAILIKISRIRRNLIILNRNLLILNRKIKSERASLKAAIINLKKDYNHLKVELQKQATNRPVDESSNGLFPDSEKDDQNQDLSENNADADLHEIDLSDNLEKMSDIKQKVLHLLEITGKPISYAEIANYLSRDSGDHDFELILKELEQLKNEGEIISHVSAGKLYFQKIAEH